MCKCVYKILIWLTTSILQFQKLTKRKKINNTDRQTRDKSGEYHLVCFSFISSILKEINQEPTSEFWTKWMTSHVKI